MKFNFFKSANSLLIFGSLLTVFSNFDNSYAAEFRNSLVGNYTVHFENPEFVQDVSVEDLDIPNGSMINFAAGGIIGKTIRAASALNEIDNPLGLSHSAIVINENPRYIFSKVLSLTPGGKYDEGKYYPLSEKAGKSILDELIYYNKDIISMTEDPGIIRSFCIEANGSVKDVLKGIAPYTQIHNLSQTILDYDGNIYIRQLIKGLNYKYTRGFIKDYLGRPYESLSNIKELLGSVKGLNNTERTENVFCSELCACFYRGAGVISPEINVSNVIPEYFGSRAGKHDLLTGRALEDVPLKVKYDFSQSDIKGKGCCGWFFSCCGPDAVD